jgi:hypothetical protein
MSLRRETGADAPKSPVHPFEAGPFPSVETAFQRLGAGSPRPARRALLVAMAAWLPLLLLAGLQGLAWRAEPREAFLLDLSAHARYLVALPILVFARSRTLASLNRIGRHFLEAGFITDADRPSYDALMASTRRLLCSGRVALALVVAAYAGTLAGLSLLYPATVSTWTAPITGGTGALSLAGWWRLLVSQPLFNLLVALWLWRLVLWARFVWRVAWLDLQLVPAHPDLRGGLQFVTTSLRSFILVTFALSAAIAGGVAELVAFGGRPLAEFGTLVGVLVGVVLLLFAAPLLPLTFPLRRAKVHGIYAYGELSALVGRRFETRWAAPTSRIGDEALEATDFSNIGGLFGAAANVRQMQIYPIGLRALVPLVIAALLPFALLVLFTAGVKQALKFAGGSLM